MSSGQNPLPSEQIQNPGYTNNHGEAIMRFDSTFHASIDILQPHWPQWTKLLLRREWLHLKVYTTKVIGGGWGDAGKVEAAVSLSAWRASAHCVRLQRSYIFNWSAAI